MFEDSHLDASFEDRAETSDFEQDYPERDPEPLDEDDEERQDEEPDDSMDGDHESALASVYGDNSGDFESYDS